MNSMLIRNDLIDSLTKIRDNMIENPENYWIL